MFKEVTFTSLRTETSQGKTRDVLFWTLVNDGSREIVTTCVCVWWVRHEELASRNWLVLIYWCG